MSVVQLAWSGACASAHAQAEIGYWIGMEYWNQGYCSEAGRILVRFGFDTLKLHRIEGRHPMRNPAPGPMQRKRFLESGGRAELPLEQIAERVLLRAEQSLGEDSCIRLAFEQQEMRV